MPEVIGDGVEVTATFGLDGAVVPHAFKWRETTYAVLEVGRQWHDEGDGALHVLVLTAADEAYELAFWPPDATWTLERRWPQSRFA